MNRAVEQTDPVRSFLAAVTQPRLVCDIDGTLAERDLAACIVLNAKFGTEYGYEDVTSHKGKDWIDDPDAADWWQKNRHDPLFLGNLAPYQDAQWALWSLRSGGYHVTVSSDREVELTENSREWLAQWEIEYDDLRIGEGEKLAIAEASSPDNPVVFFDDNPNRAADLPGPGRTVILLDRPWNQEVKPGPGIIRVKTWPEVISHLPLQATTLTKGVLPAVLKGVGWNEDDHPRDEHGHWLVTGNDQAREIVDRNLAGVHDGMAMRAAAMHDRIAREMRNAGLHDHAARYRQAVYDAKRGGGRVHPREAAGKANVGIHQQRIGMIQPGEKPVAGWRAAAGREHGGRLPAGAGIDQGKVDILRIAAGGPVPGAPPGAGAVRPAGGAFVPIAAAERDLRGRPLADHLPGGLRGGAAGHIDRAYARGEIDRGMRDRLIAQVGGGRMQAQVFNNPANAAAAAARVAAEAERIRQEKERQFAFGKDIQPQFFPTHDQITKLEGVGGGHINGTYHVYFKDGTEGAFKPLSGEHAQAKSEEQYKSEIGAHVVDRTLGLNIVPNTEAYWHPDHGIGSMQEWAKGATAAQSPSSYTAADREKMAVLDHVIENNDRHHGNYLTGSDGRPIAIDNGLAFGGAFGNNPSPFPREVGTLSSSMRDAIRNADYQKLESDLLKVGLKQEKIDKMFERMSRMLMGAHRGDTPPWKRPRP